MNFSEMISNNKTKWFCKKYFICNYDEEENLKSIPWFECEIQKNRDKLDSRVKISTSLFPFFHQVAQFEMEKWVTSDTLKQELIIAKDEWYNFPNGTFVKLLKPVRFL